MIYLLGAHLFVSVIFAGVDLKNVMTFILLYIFF